MYRWTILALLAPCAIVLAVMSSRAPAPVADFVVACDAFRTIDPHRVSWLDEIQTSAALFEGLTRLDPLTLQPVAAAAESWTVSEDGRTYTFALRAGLRWSNGDPLTADDFRWSWFRVLDPAVAAQYASLLFVLDGAAEYYRSRAGADAADDLPASVVGIEVLDARTLRVRLAAPCSYLLDLTAFPTFAPVHRPTLERFAYRDGRVLTSTQHLWTRPENIVCNGAYTLTRWDFKRRLLLERNAHYWNHPPADDAQAVRTIEIFITSNINAALLAYQTGRIHLIRGLPPEISRALKDEAARGERHDFVLGDRFATFFLRVNCRRPPLNDANLRKALTLAIDKQAICERVMGQGETPADTYVPPASIPLMPREAADGSTVFYEPPAGLGAGLSQARRVALARNFLARSGYDPARGRPIRIAYATDPPQQRSIAQAVQHMWETSLGIRVELEVLERKVLSQRIRDLDYDVARSDWFGDYMDPSTFLDMFTSDGGQNRTGWSHAEYDRCIAAAAVEPDAAKRFSLLRRAEQILCEEELPILPIFFRRGNYLLSPRFTGVADNVREILPIHEVRLAPQESQGNKVTK